MKAISKNHFGCIAFCLMLVSLVASCAVKLNSRKHAYLFTSFREDSPQGLRFLYSYDGYHWTNIPGRFLIPQVGPSKLLRDPSLSRERDGTFHLVWTTGW